MDSIELLINSGLDFNKHRLYGIPHHLFAEHLITSGICMNPDMHWITFHGGVDFGYLLKSLTGQKLPSDEGAYF